MAGCSISLDAMEHGCLIDDQATVEGFGDTMKRIAELKKGWVEAQAAREAA
jgi:hypothetical protein